MSKEHQKRSPFRRSQINADDLTLLKCISKSSRETVHRAKLCKKDVIITFLEKDPRIESSRSRVSSFLEIKHPFVNEVHGWSEVDGKRGIVEDYLPLSLTAIYKGPHMFPFVSRLRLLSQLAEAVAFLHSRSAYHGRLAPAHVKLRPSLKPRLASPNWQKSGGKRKPTPFDAPKEPRSVAADVFSLGLLSIFVLTGEDPAVPAPQAAPLGHLLPALVPPFVVRAIERTLLPVERRCSADGFAVSLLVPAPTAQPQSASMDTPPLAAANHVPKLNFARRESSSDGRCDVPRLALAPEPDAASSSDHDLRSLERRIRSLERANRDLRAEVAHIRGESCDDAPPSRETRGSHRRKSGAKIEVQMTGSPTMRKTSPDKKIPLTERTAQRRMSFSIRSPLEGIAEEGSPNPVIRPSNIRFDGGSLAAAKVIGSGTYGIVYLGFYNMRPVAVKVLKPGFDPMTAGFVHEIDMMGKVSHPNILRFWGSNTAPPPDPNIQNAFIVTEYIPGGTLLQAVTGAQPPLSTEQRLRILIKILEVVHYLHSLSPPIAHLDLKPENVLLTERLEPRVIDFGIARELPAGVARSRHVLGTPYYQAPETLKGFVSLKADVYSLGILCFFVLASRLPYGTVTLEGPRDLPNMALPDSVGVSAALQATLAQCVCMAREDRPTAAALNEALRAEYRRAKQAPGK
eukprot:gnl/Chilomastix_cuspidata/193.p1 GENE.gnl/Chilomastix_cuspidata/193~~gnl/Chilomastix_cuspidata/193.p1  ORF type:complete len:685 (-),score=258.73 gnl/Chilomastix_cuspidata/193:1143-3197(-)